MKIINGITILLIFGFISACGNEETSQTEGNETHEELATEIIEEEIPQDDVAEDLMGNGGPADECWGNQRVYLNDPDLSGTNIRNSPNGEIVGQLFKDEDNPEYFITILEARDGWFRIDNVVNTPNGLGGSFNEAGECWMHGSVLGIDTRNYGGEVIPVFAYPNPETEHITSISQETYGLQVTDICGEWIKIQSKDKKIDGWVESRWLCGNPLTTCS